MRRLARYLPRFRRAEAALGVLAEHEQWTRADITRHQLDRLNELWLGAIADVPYYRSLRDRLNLPERFASLAEFSELVPLLSKDTVRRDPQQFLSARPGPGVWQRSSGSTGTPISVFRNADAHKQMLQAKYRFHQVYGLRIFDPIAWLWSSESITRRGWSGHVQALKQAGIDYLRNRLRLPAAKLHRSDLRRHLKRISAFRPRAMYCYSRAAHLLAREAIEVGFRRDRLRVVIIAGESATEHMIHEIRRAFGVPVVMEYGCVEFGFVAGQMPDHTLRVREDIVLVETLKRADGRYDLVLTTLNNASFPLLRYQIGDLTAEELVRPKVGFAILPEVMGRDDDQLVTGNGGIVGSSSIDAIFEGEHFETVRRYRVHQGMDGGLTVQVEPIDELAPPNLKAIEAQLAQVACGLAVRVQRVSAVGQTAGGKHRVVTSDLYAQRKQALGKV